MAEGESVKLFVSQVPKKMTVAQLFEVFREFALVDKVEIMRDKETGASLGCGFVICPSTVEANKAVFACHDKITLPGAYRRLHMKYADGELERLEHKLLVRTLPKTVSRVHMSTLLSKDGKREDVQILRGSGQTSKGCAFMKSETLEQELAAVMESLNVKHKMEQIASEQHQSVYGPLPMSSVPDQVNPKRRSMQKSSWCRAGVANNAVLWSLRQHRLQPSPDSLPCIYRSYSFWESVANLANRNFDLNLNVQSALGLAAEMKEACSCGEAQSIFSNPIDYGSVHIPQFDELIGGEPSVFISDEVLPYVNNFVDASPSHTFISHVNPIAEVSTSQALVTSIPNEPGPPTKKRKATLDELQSFFVKCPNLPRKTAYKAIKVFKCEATLSMWMKDTLQNKLDFLEDLTPRSSLKAFLIWRHTTEALSLE